MILCFCAYSVYNICCVILHFPYFAQVIYVSLAYLYSEYMCIHPSICPCYCACMDLSGSNTAVLLALTNVFRIGRVTCFQDSSSCMKVTRTQYGSVKDHMPSNLDCTVLLSITNRLYPDIVSADNANKHTVPAVTQWTLAVL